MSYQVPKSWERITDPELCWLAMVDARSGSPSPWGGGLRYFLNGGVDLYAFPPGEQGRSVVVQRSLVGRVGDRRFTVVWSPIEPTQAPAVYVDPALNEGKVPA